MEFRQRYFIIIENLKAKISKNNIFYVKNKAHLAIKEKIKAFNFYISIYGKHKRGNNFSHTGL